VAREGGARHDARELGTLLAVEDIRARNVGESGFYQGAFDGVLRVLHPGRAAADRATKSSTARREI
jgi:hypothetical protein